MLTSSKIEKDVIGHYSVNSSYSREYEDYVIRQQLLKAKAPKLSSLSAGEEMAFAAEKLMLAKTEVGKLSIPLSQMRRSLGQSNSLSTPKLLDAYSLLEGLENNVISAKHYTSEQLGTMRQQVEGLANAASAGRGKEVARIAEDIFKHNPQAKSILEQTHNDIFINGEKRTIRGLDLTEISENLSKAMSSFKAPGGNTYSEDILDKMMRGRIKVGRGAINEYLNYGGGNLSPIKLEIAQSLFSRVSKNVISAKNRVAAVGGNILEHSGKPLGIAFGTALAIGAILSKPLSNLGPGSSSPPVSTARIASANSSGISPENIHPDENTMGNPSIPSTKQIPQARISQNEQSTANVFIRGLDRKNINIPTLSNILSRNLGKNTNSNINIRDKRTSMSEEKIDSIIRR